ncbi:hypothetical protein ACFQY0_02590 [Haloferula chungangensis]|uniref:Uncharacterized protein n=1 Tax=Haloferula chungangensis TaxID=1048331 RepID=A0ABW2L130_9BACT
MISRIFPIILLTAALVSPLPAQNEKLDIRTLSLGSSNFPELWVMEDTAPVAVKFSSIQPSEPLRIPRSNPLRIFKGELDEKGLPKDTTPTSVKLPNNSSILLLAWMNGEAPRFLPIPDPFKSAKHDDWLVINGSAQQVAIQIGAKSKPVSVAPSSHSRVRVTAPVNEGAAVTVATRNKKAWKTIYSTYWPIYPDKRCLVIIAQDGRKMRVKVISDEYKEPEEEKP